MSGSNAVDVVKEKVNGILSKYPAIDEPLGKLAAKAKIDKAFVAIGIAVVVLLLLFTLGSGDLLIDLIGFAYPFYASIRAIESEDKEDDTQWLTYWLVFALFKIVEGVADFLISFIPFYFLLKLAFLAWCQYPTTQGALVIYKNVIKPHIVPKLGLDAETTDKKEN